MDYRIVLGSGSPRRKEILETFDIPFIVDPADIDESNVDPNLTPKEYTSFLSERKAKALAHTHPNSIILTADTMVFCENTFLGKPKSAEEAIKILTMLGGKPHVVGTSISITKDQENFTLYDETVVTLRKLTLEQIRKYVEVFSPLDKAGAYGIQDCGGLLIQKIEGNFHNVVGFEIKLVEKLFGKVGINLWDYLKKSHCYL